MPATIRPLPGPLGAEVVSFDVRDLVASRGADLVEALHDRLLLVFREQSLSVDDQIALTEIFGRLDTRPSPPDAPFRHTADARVRVVTNEGKDGLGLAVVTLFWHTDLSFLPEPPPITVLRAVNVPAAGGDTEFANMRLAYDMLSLARREQIDGLTARHTFAGALVGANDTAEPLRCDSSADAWMFPAVTHPLVLPHPETGRRALYLNPLCLDGIVGLTREESIRLLADLQSHALSTAFRYRHRWHPGDLIVWDNAALLHRAVDLAGANARVLYRTNALRPRGSGTRG